jgi:hypothetical protein
MPASVPSTMTKKIALVLASSWLGWTVLVDFFIIPTVFATVHDFFLAGELGIAVFSKLNRLEIIVATILMSLFAIEVHQTHRQKIGFFLSILSWIIVMFYFTYLTDKIIELTVLWKKVDAEGGLGIAGIIDVQQEHQFFHRMYVGLDSLKLLILSFIIAIDVFKKDVTS